MTLNKFRSKLYRLSKFLGDVQAVKSGKIGKRVQRRVLGKIFGKWIRRIVK